LYRYAAARFLWIDLATIELYYGALSCFIPGLRFAWLAVGRVARHFAGCPLASHVS
jgi:hypothetical protein